MKIRFNTSLVTLAVATSLFAFNAMADINDGPNPRSVAPASLTPTQGAVFCTAAINADGTNAQKAAGSTVLSTTHLGTGNYEVLFRAPCGNITAANGFARFVQTDTLTTGTTNGHCSTADRAGHVNGVFINCVDVAGAPADNSFFLFVTR